MRVERLLLLSGPIGSGKTEVAKELIRTFQFAKVTSGGYLTSLIPPNELKEGDERRQQLQELGDRLDEETGYRWIVDPVAIQAMQRAPSTENWLIDAVRKKRQVELFREHFGSIVRHVHLVAAEDVLRSRYAKKGGNYDAAIAHPNEVNARSLHEVADLLLDTSEEKAELLATRILSTWECQHG
jgi:dephospho-CoA kinase